MGARLHGEPIAQGVQPRAQHSVGELLILGVELPGHVVDPRVRGLHRVVKRRDPRFGGHDCLLETPILVRPRAGGSEHRVSAGARVVGNEVLWDGV